MPNPVMTAPPATTPDRYGGDPAVFDAQMQAWLAWEALRQPEETALVAWVATQVADTTTLKNTATAQAAAAQADRTLCAAAQAAVAAQSPVTNAAAAAASAVQAQAYASTAQATNPDSPIRLNPRTITASFTVASAYNAASAGPITISEGVTVTISDNATWSVH